MAWTVIRLELHHLWNPDWTYAFPNQQHLDYAYAYADGAYYDDDEDQYGQLENGDFNGGGEAPDVSESEEDEGEAEPYDEHAEEMLNDFKVE